MVENYTKDIKESVYHRAVISVLAVGFRKSNPAHFTSQNKRTVLDQGAWYIQTIWLQ